MIQQRGLLHPMVHLNQLPPAHEAFPLPCLPCTLPVQVPLQNDGLAVASTGFLVSPQAHQLEQCPQASDPGFSHSAPSIQQRTEQRATDMNVSSRAGSDCKESLKRCTDHYARGLNEGRTKHARTQNSEHRACTDALPSSTDQGSFQIHSSTQLSPAPQVYSLADLASDLAVQVPMQNTSPVVAQGGSLALRPADRQYHDRSAPPSAINHAEPSIQLPTEQRATTPRVVCERSSEEEGSGSWTVESGFPTDLYSSHAGCSTTSEEPVPTDKIESEDESQKTTLGGVHTTLAKPTEQSGSAASKGDAA